jgi:hypothetical protein
MAYCTNDQVRNVDEKLKDPLEVIEDVITERIEMAESIIQVDLSSIISGQELDNIGGSSKVINLMAIYKSTELILVKYYGASRKVDELDDVQYFQKQYNNLLKKLLSGDIELVSTDGNYAPKDYPSIDKGRNKKFYVRKGIDGLLPEGEQSFGNTYVDDTVKN